MKSDIEIAREVSLRKIKEIATGLGIPREEVQNYGRYIAKIPIHLIDEEKIRQHNLILVTAITPTKAGIGKTTVSIGLALGLNKIGKKAVVALREPSLGPCFGMKGGAAGGGYSQVLPMENINLHFTGDFHAVTSAHNMITALLDNYIYQTRNTCEGLKEIKWKRVLDVNDRSLRNIVSGLGGSANGVPTETGFDITPASEIMAILCLATDIEDLKRRIGNILLGYTNDDKPFTVNDLGVAGAITVLLKDALLPNLVQTTENTAAFVHGGPFANIAHGCNSVLATKMALTYGDYVITEAGFGADLGAEKFFDIKCRKAGLTPKLTVIVATAQSLKLHGGVPENKIKEQNIEGMKNGFENLDKHVENMKCFGQEVIVTFNRYASDTDEEIALVAEHCREIGVGFCMNNVFAAGGEGGTVELVQGHAAVLGNNACHRGLSGAGGAVKDHVGNAAALDGAAEHPPRGQQMLLATDFGQRFGAHTLRQRFIHRAFPPVLPCCSAWALYRNSIPHFYTNSKSNNENHSQMDAANPIYKKVETCYYHSTFTRNEGYR